MSVCQLFFKRVDLVIGDPGGFRFILNFDIVFQIVPAVTVNKDIPRRRKAMPERGKERLLPSKVTRVDFASFFTSISFFR